MDTNFAARILALPEPVRATLATVDGPGWSIRPPWAPGAPSTVEPEARCPDLRYLPPGSAWWSANPARSVAAVVGLRSLHHAYGAIGNCLTDGDFDDHAAALAIIEAHVARTAAPRQTVTNLGKVGEVVNIQGPVTLSIGADGVKVVR